MAKVLKRLREILKLGKLGKPQGSMSVAFKVTHADGTEEDLGVVSETPLEWKTEGR